MCFTVWKRTQDEKPALLGNVVLNLVGVHNVKNALAAFAVADAVGVPFAIAADVLANFAGVQRRFTVRGEAKGALIVDDYGHHPAELRATLSAARAACPDRRIVWLFQPHRYTRTAALLDQFAAVLADADQVVLCPIYAAGEAPIVGADIETLAQRVREAMAASERASLENIHKEQWVKVASSVDEGVQMVHDLTRPHDLILTQGAGDITQAGPRLLALLSAAS